MSQDALFFMIQATEYLRKVYCLEPNDIDLTEQKCEQALKHKETPQEYIDSIAEKHNLTKLENFTYEQAVRVMSKFADPSTFPKPSIIDNKKTKRKK